MARSPVMNFMKQQGFTQEPPDRATLRFKGLQFQPTIVGSMMLVAILTQSPAIFLLVSALLWLNVLVPAANPFEKVYNRLVAQPRGRPLLTKAPGPRRFAQGMAATFMLAGVLRPPGAPRRGLRRAPVRKVLPGRVRLPSAEGERRLRQWDLSLE